MSGFSTHALVQVSGNIFPAMTMDDERIVYRPSLVEPATDFHQAVLVLQRNVSPQSILGPEGTPASRPYRRVRPRRIAPFDTQFRVAGAPRNRYSGCWMVRL